MDPGGVICCPLVLSTKGFHAGLPKSCGPTVSSAALCNNRPVCRLPTCARCYGRTRAPCAGPTGSFGAARSGQRTSVQGRIESAKQKGTGRSRRDGEVAMMVAAVPPFAEIPDAAVDWLRVGLVLVSVSSPCRSDWPHQLRRRRFSRWRTCVREAPGTSVRLRGEVAPAVDAAERPSLGTQVPIRTGSSRTPPIAGACRDPRRMHR